MEKTIVSFKQNTRVINKTKNKFLKWVNTENGKIEKQLVPQIKGQNWAIRKSLHKATIYGKVTLTREGKTFEATAGRITLSDSFTRKQLDKITDTGIQKILNNHVKNYDENFSDAFSPEGIEALNANIQSLNDGKPHQPIYAVRVYEVGNKFPVGTRGSKSSKFVEADKGTNLFFAIYKGKNKKGEEVRTFESIPLNVAIEEMKQGGSPAKPFYFDKNKNEFKLLFTLSPNDLVYVPTKDEIENPSLVDFKKLSKSQVERIYKMVSSTGIQCFFIRNEVANSVKDKYEFSALNKTEKDLNGGMVKALCWKLKVNRIGQIEQGIY